MRRSIRHFLCALAILPTAALTARPNEGRWVVISEDGGIIVYRRAEDSRATVTIRGETTIAAPSAAIIAVMLDSPRASEWVPFVHEKRDLQVIGPDERLEYTHTRLPWPLKDRYFINRGKMEQLPAGIVHIYVHSVDNPPFKEDDKILGQLYYADFVLTPRDGGRTTHILLEINSDPKGWIPTWMINLAQVEWPRKFFSGLNDQLAHRGLMERPGH